MLNILLLADGRSFHTERFLAEIKKRGHQITLASLEIGQLEQVTFERKGSIAQLHYFRAIPQLIELIKKLQPDLISAHFASGYGFIAARANRSFNLPLMTNLWGSDILIVPHKSFLHRWKTKYALKNSDFIVGDSHYLIGEANKIYPFKNKAVIPWGIEERYLALHKSDYNYSTPLKVIVPRPHETVYNNQFIIKALKPLLSENKIEITFPNFGSLVDDFKKSCVDLPNINFYNKLNRDEFLKFMASHDIYLSASRSDSSPVSLIEAMALGLLPVAANIKGVREWLDEKSGFPYGENDYAELLQIISSLVDEPKDYAEMRQQNLARVKSEAIFEKNIDYQLELIEKMVR